MNFKAGVCNLCGTGCGHFLRTDGNHVSAVTPLIKHPVSKGKLCVRGWHIHELLNTHERIETPLIRENGKFRAVDMKEAVSLVMEKLSAFKDPSREVGVIASARSSNEDSYLLMKLARTVLRTSNIGISAESGHKNSLSSLDEAFGVPGALGRLADIDQTKYILVIGTDITKQNPIIGSNIHRAAMAGARLVTLCSTRTQIAKLSAKHFQQKPGSKRLVVNAFAKALLEVRVGDSDFAAKQLPGFKEYSETLGKLSPAEISVASGIPYEEIVAEMRTLANAESFTVLFSSGISGLDSETIRSITNFALLTGKMGKKNSGLIPVTGICNLQGSFDMGLVSDRTVGFRPLGDAKTQENLNRAWGEKALSEQGRNTFDLIADQKSGLRALFVVDHDDGVIRHKDRIGALDFVVYIGAFKNLFMDLAHVVLPISAFCEYDGTYTATDRRVQLSRVKNNPPQNVMPPWQLYSTLAAKAGKTWNYRSAEEVFKEVTTVVPSYSGMTYELLGRDFGQQWPEASGTQEGKGKFLRLETGSSALKPDPQFPFSLMVGKAQHFWHQNNLMRKTMIPRREYDAMLLLYPEGYVEISSEDAKKLQVRDKWSVNVSSSNGAMKIAVKISDDVQTGSAYIPYFIKSMISDFLIKHDGAFAQGEEAIIPVKIEKV